MATPKPKYTQTQLKRLLSDIHSGTISETNLPEDLYNALGDYFKSALYKGYGKDLSTVTKSEEALLTDLRENVYLFSAAKIYQFTRAAADQLIDEDGAIKPFNKFFEDGKAVYEQYNEDYAQAEYVTVIGQAQMAEQWQSIEQNKDVLPLLTFSTAGMPCPECAPFEGLTALVDSPIWDTCTPLLHFRCECILIPSDDAEVSKDSFIDNLPIDENIPKDFQNNPGKTGEIFNKEHPYFSESPAELGKENFGLSIPEED